MKDKEMSFFSDKEKAEMLEASKKFSEYKSKRVALEKTKEILKARLMKEAQVNGVHSTQAQERDAYASKEFEEVVNALGLAMRFETELYWKLKLFDIEIQVWRTEQANERNVIDSENFFNKDKKESLIKKSEKFALYKSRRVVNDLLRKVIRSRAMKEAESNNVKTIQAQEREAYANPKYEEVVNGFEIATRFETELYWELQLFDLEVQVWRTEQANKRRDV